MRTVRWPEQSDLQLDPTVATLGVFDGVHRGHAQVLRRVVSLARERSIQAAVVTFDRHPAAVTHARPLPAITSLEHRLRLFARMGVDICVVIRFGPDVAQIPAAEFVRRVFGDLLATRVLVLGFDCRFGRDREGDAELCRAMGMELGFDVISLPPVTVQGQPISSTAIREAIQSGDLGRAQDLLGRPVSVFGTVVHSCGLGRELGYPTANIDPHNEAIPPDGVYAAWCCINGDPVPGVASVGVRETLHPGSRERVVEVHLIGRSEDLYGRDIEVQFVELLRGQRRFESRDALVSRIGQDVADAQACLERAGGATCYE